jgi:hypothetical protein
MFSKNGILVDLQYAVSSAHQEIIFKDFPYLKVATSNLTNFSSRRAGVQKITFKNIQNLSMEFSSHIHGPGMTIEVVDGGHVTFPASAALVLAVLVLKNVSATYFPIHLLNYVTSIDCELSEFHTFG